MDLHITCFSFFDNQVYSVEQVVRLAKKCKKWGASVVHFHLEKVPSEIDFLKVAKQLEKENVALSISEKDCSRLFALNINMPQSIKYIAMHAADCNIFNTRVVRPFHKVKQQFCEYTKLGRTPEVHIFNEKGINNCLLLAKEFGYDFLPVVNMGYPKEMEISYNMIANTIEKLKEFTKIMFVLFNNTDSEMYRLILQHGGGIRIGLEDNIYCGDAKAVDCVDSAKYISQLVKF